jgi:hypothetical protein
VSANGPIFVLGAQRSGTTLVRLILNAHPLIAIPEEATFLMPFLCRKCLKGRITGTRLQNLVAYLRLNPQFRLWNYDNSGFLNELAGSRGISLRELVEGLFGSYCRSEGKAVWGDKTPSFFRKVDILSELFPEAKFIHIVRDGRDVFESWRRIDPTKGNPAVTALDWSYKIWRIERSLRNVPEERKITVRYEDLLSDPENTVKALCRLIGVAYYEAMLDFHKTSRKYVGAHHSNLIFTPLDRKNSAKWKATMNPRDARVFGFLSNHALKKLGYEAGVKLGAVDAAFMLWSLAIGLPMRAYGVFRIKTTLERAARQGEAPKGLSVGQLPSVRRDDESPLSQ